MAKWALYCFIKFLITPDLLHNVTFHPFGLSNLSFRPIVVGPSCNIMHHLFLLIMLNVLHSSFYDAA